MLMEPEHGPMNLLSSSFCNEAAEHRCIIMKSVVKSVVKYIIIIDGLEQVQDYSDHICEEEDVHALSITKLKVEPGDNARVKYTI
jgi:hypothetical protein